MALGISLERGPGGPRCVQHEQTLLKCSHVSRSSKSQCCVPERSELGATFRKLLNTGEAQVADSGNFRHGDVLLLGVSPGNVDTQNIKNITERHGNAIVAEL